ncbi:acetate/propionate family kinase [Helicobacter baculiformis]|uniref:Acetate kinase n=1 Tax=Helicobacter baculiformis TaxID=427351 RepID=A0ABV7ZHM5_9HELI|nr:acetate kinase [Helicobacter baculiformis]
MHILVLNLGSSSIKFQLFHIERQSVLAKGLVEQIGGDCSQIQIYSHEGCAKISQECMRISTYEEGLQHIEYALRDLGILESLGHVDGVGHRVVHGGDLFIKPTLITDEVIAHIEKLAFLAPLHNPAHLMGIKTLKQKAPHVPQVAVFDTAFHQSIPAHAFMYALPYDLYETYKLRRYGFHGTSHHFVAMEAANFLGIPYEQFNAISLHLGNGASVCAIEKGKSVDTSMGLTPLEGLIMGTRSGDLDPALLGYIMQIQRESLEEVNDVLNKESGLKGLCGKSDMRSVEALIEKGDEKAQLAFDMYAYRIRKYVGSYLLTLGRIDALIFTGGVGENCARLRKAVCANLENFGMILDLDTNSNPPKGVVNLSQSNTAVQILRVPTNEEWAIANQSAKIIQAC